MLYKDEILAEITQQLPQKDSGLQKIVLYGSVSRGEATPMSDIDLVLITTNILRTKEVFHEMRTSIFIRYSVPVTALYVLPERFATSMDPLYSTIRKVGVQLWKKKGI